MATHYVQVAEKTIHFSRDRLTTGATFDVVLSKPDPSFQWNDASMYKLTIKLRFCMQQAYPGPQVKEFGSNGATFDLKPWDATDWRIFLDSAKAQANLWNNQFWLKPPPNMTEYDLPVRFSGPEVLSYLRPYVECELEVDFNASKANAHYAIDVYNLDTSKITGNKDSGTFRSDSLHYDSLDGIPWRTKYRDDRGHPIMHYTIAHEIGHAIGQPHIGVLRQAPLCVAAMNVEDLGGGGDGQNAAACYADDIPDLGKNVMGGGGAWSADNARPWLYSMMFLRDNRPEYWQILTTKPARDVESVQH
jgi:hypothetical protein